MGILPDIGYPQTGDSVKPGIYVCLNCPHDEADDKSLVSLKKESTLPKCPVCGNTYWLKI